MWPACLVWQVCSFLARVPHAHLVLFVTPHSAINTVRAMLDTRPYDEYMHAPGGATPPERLHVLPFVTRPPAIDGWVQIFRYDVYAPWPYALPL